ncbi:RasGEF domain containing protein [Histomonas meleagridis]|uniref:RasGEF domain containing protein n=1 Tax=Histomonas meleagridis TaxID=135588 RepID=UPI00355996C7|nr:RasGEF domain containing protein [Histomonas meleagridis]KAH0807056.1 RasGEF domain containing protein [Histomonas meleagridis]
MDNDIAELNRQYNEYTNQLSQYVQACKQYTDYNQTLVQKKNQLEADIHNFYQYVQTHPVRPDEEELVQVQYKRLAGVQAKAVKAQEILNRLVPDTKMEIPEIYQSQKMNEFKSIAKTVRQLYARKESLKKSIDYLERESTNLRDERDDLQAQLAEDRKWANEMEEKLASETQAGMQKLMKHKEQIKQLDETYQKELIETEKKRIKADVDSIELNLFNNQYQRQFSKLQEDLNLCLTKKGIPSSNIQLVKQLQSEVTALQERSEEYSKLLSANFQLQQAKQQESEVKQIYSEIRDDYLNHYKKVDVLIHQTLKDHIEQKSDVLKVLSDNQEELKELETIQNQLKETNQQLHKETEKLDEEAKSKHQNKFLNKKLISKYESINEKIDSIRVNIEHQNNSIAYNQTFIQKYDQGIATVQDIYNRFRSETSTVARRRLVGELESLFEQQHNLLNDLANNNAKSLQNITNQIEELQRRLEKAMSDLLRSVDPEKSFSQQSERILKEQSESLFHGDEGLVGFMPDECEISLTNENEANIEVASLNALVALLFHPHVFKDRYHHQFILGWHNTGTSLTLLTEMINGFLKEYQNGSNPYGLPNTDQLTDAIVNDTINFFYTWRYDFTHDFVGLPESKDLRLNVHLIFNTLSQLDKSKKQEGAIDTFVKSIDLFNNTKTYQPPRSIKQPTFLDLPYDSTKPFPLRTDPVILAKHFMFVELKKFVSIERYEFVKCNWSRPNRDTISPNLSELTRHFNKTSVLVGYTILTEKRLKERAKILGGWISVMDAALNVNNFNLLFEIDGALTNPAIIRLKKTWSKIDKELKDRYTKLSDLTAPFRKFGKYKAALNSCPVNMTLPYLGPWLTDMTFVEDGNPTRKTLPNNEEGINFTKQKYYYSPCSFLLKDWGKDINFDINQQIVSDINSFRSVDEEGKEYNLLKMSRECETE